MPATWQSSGFAIWLPYRWHTEGIWQNLCVLYDIHTAGIWQSQMPAMWYQYGSYIWLNHIAAILIPHCRYIWLCIVISMCKSICLLYGIHMAAIWYSHTETTCLPHGSHLALPYGCHIDDIQKAYGKTICVLYDIHTAGIWQSQMPAMWYQYGSYMWLNHIAAILIPHCKLQLEKELLYTPLSQVRQKCVILSLSNNIVVLPLLHQVGFPLPERYFCWRCLFNTSLSIKRA